MMSRAHCFGVAVSVCLMLIGGDVSAQTPCDRACLTTLLDQYLKAVIAHDPAAAPLMVGFRQTENAVVTTPGEGLWKSLTALGKLQRRYFDPVTGAAGYYGTISEGGEAGVATLRLQVDDRRISEAEWVIGRANTGGPLGPGPGSTSAEGAESAPPPDKPLPRAARVPRKAMLALANGYFDSLTSGTAALMVAHAGWVRVENGIGTGEGPGGARRGGGAGPAGAPAAAPAPPAGGGRGVPPGIIAVARRYPLVDEEAGVVLGMVVFVRPPGSPMRRNLLTEWFAIDGGRIRGIYAAMHYLDPNAMAPNWPPYDGNWPLPAPAPR